MLVLTRKTEEAILIGADITVRVLAVSGDKVRIGIDAPKSMKIIRAETLQKTIEENRSAAAGADFDLTALANLKD